MSWQASSWAARQTAGNSGRKALLMLIANASDPQGVSFVGRARLADQGECRPETVTANLRALEEAGLLSRHQRRRENGSRTTDWIVLGPAWADRGEMLDADPDEYPAGVAWDATKRSGEESSGEVPGAGQVRNPQGPEPSGETVERPSRRKGATAAVAPAPVEMVPDEFPDELRPHARIVLKLLREVAEQHGARRVSALALGRTMMVRPHKPFVRSAHDFAAWAADPPRPIRDVVASYRTWLDRERDLQGVEPVKGQSREKGGARTGRFDRKVTRDAR